MRTEIRSHLPEGVEEIREFVERRIAFALDRFTGHVHKVTVSVSDQNGPKGGIDKCCQVLVSGVGSFKVYVEQTAQDTYSAINGALKRVSYAVARHVDKLGNLSPSHA